MLRLVNDVFKHLTELKDRPAVQVAAPLSPVQQTGGSLPGDQACAQGL